MSIVYDELLNRVASITPELAQPITEIVLQYIDEQDEDGIMAHRRKALWLLRSSNRVLSVAEERFAERLLKVIAPTQEELDRLEKLYESMFR
jgi:hypothetical protein